MRILFFFVLTFELFISHAQNLITNPDFESFTTCPTFLGQANNAISWSGIINSSDYYNCGLSTAPYNSNSTAYTGTGFMGFASTGYANGSAEAIGQSLAQSLKPGYSYSISFAAKKPSSGQGIDTCGGVAVYGFKENLPSHATFVHASSFPNAVLLGTSSAVQDTVWKLFSFNFTPTDSINHIVFTVQQSPWCYQCIFLDNVILNWQGDTSLINTSPTECKDIFIPNAFSPNKDGQNDELQFFGGNCIKDFYLKIYDRWGEKVFETTDITQGWDGTFKGQKLNPDVFVYQVSALSINGEPIIKKGNVTLIK